MYKIQLENKTIIADDYAVVNLDENKTLHIRLTDNTEIEYYVNYVNWSVEQIEQTN